MNRFKQMIICTALVATTLSVGAAVPDLHPEHTLWFEQPAADWRTQALHLGNGYMGVSFYGGVETETFDIAEKTFWTGGPNAFPNYNYGIKPGGKEHIDEIRQLVLSGQIQKADSLTRCHFFGDMEGYGYFSRVGAIKLAFPVLPTTTSSSSSDHSPLAAVTHYKRGLDLREAVGFVTYSSEGVNYSREYFCSYPDRSFVAHMEADKPGKVSFKVLTEWQYSTEKVEVVNRNEWLIRGLIDKSGLKYCIRMKLVNNGGRLVATANQLAVEEADRATLYFTVETEYMALPPLYKGNDPVKHTLKSFKRMNGLNYEEIRKRHVDDYASLYNRVDFRLAGDEALAQLPTDKRVQELKSGMTDDSQLKSLWFNLGRYSIISASRKGTLPSNLQGVWNHFESAPWNANYQSNINLQEMYWSCGPTNLPECQESYTDWIKTLLVPGRKVAQAYYGTEGWVTHATTNIWGYTSPGVDLMWGIYPVAAAWHCRHLWDQYVFTTDKNYLKETAYPIMREAALFYLHNLQQTKDGLCFVPGVTAEHGIELGKEGRPVTYSTLSGESNKNKVYLTPCFQDIEMIYDLFSNVIRADEALGTQDQLVEEIKEARSKLIPLKIGRYGQLQEWIIDADNPRDHHRHIPHLYALYPGEMITAATTPELFAAAKKSLDMRGDGVYKSRWPHSGGNWSSAWRIACRARLFEGERAIHIFNEMIREVGFENMMSSQSGNFQVDAMMATPGLFAELLLQSHDECLHLLPALPSEWPEGEVKGLVARGGYKVSLKWKYGQLQHASIEVPSNATLPPLKLAGQELSSSDKRITVL